MGRDFVDGIGDGDGYGVSSFSLSVHQLTFFFSSPVQSTYQNDPQHLSGLVRRILYQFIGPN